MQLVAVSKTVPVERLRAAVEAGFGAFGENRVQEAADKIAALPDVEWHLVGHLQGNKAGRARDLFNVIQSVDSLDLARRLARHRDAGAASGNAPYPVYLQVTVDNDPQKAGFAPSELEASIDELASLAGLRLAGLMTVGRLVDRGEDARPTFARLAELSVRLRARAPGLEAGLSMGMSDDFTVAVAEAQAYLARTDSRFVLGLGGPGRRRRLAAQFRGWGGQLTSITAFTAVVSPFAAVGPGANVMQHTLISPTAVLGEGVLLNAGAAVHHDSVVGDYCEISPGARILGHCRLGQGCWVGAAAVILPGVVVGPDAIIGAGAIVTRPVEAGTTVVGIPARLMS